VKLSARAEHPGFLALKPGPQATLPVMHEGLDGSDEIGIMVSAIDGAVDDDFLRRGWKAADDGPGERIRAIGQREAHAASDRFAMRDELSPRLPSRDSNWLMETQYVGSDPISIRARSASASACLSTMEKNSGG
jgi:hypothetical protein